LFTVSILISEKVAIPATAATVNVPPIVAAPADGSVPKARVTLSVALATKLFEASLISTVMAGVILKPLLALVGSWVITN
jgi:hypothetical protein